MAVVPGCLVERELLLGELVMPFDIDVSCGRGYFICSKRDTPDFAARDRFAQWLANQAGGDRG